MVKEATSLKLESDLMEKVKKYAKIDNRAISNYIATVLRKHFEEIEKQKTPTD